MGGHFDWLRREGGGGANEVGANLSTSGDQFVRGLRSRYPDLPSGDFEVLANRLLIQCGQSLERSDDLFSVSGTRRTSGSVSFGSNSRFTEIGPDGGRTYSVRDLFGKSR